MIGAGESVSRLLITNAMVGGVLTEWSRVSMAITVEARCNHRGLTDVKVKPVGCFRCAVFPRAYQKFYIEEIFPQAPICQVGMMSCNR